MLSRLDLPEPDGPINAVRPGPAAMSNASETLPSRRLTAMSNARSASEDMRASTRHAPGQPLRHDQRPDGKQHRQRSEEHTSEIQSLMRIPYALFCLKNKKKHTH